jgi:probable rRNA maturation factor
VIHISSSTDPLPVASESIERAAGAALRHESASGDLSIVLAGDAQLQQLNREYLGIDAPTDVLSFPASETDPESGAAYLGDILISVPRAAQQAAAAGHPLASEVQLLVVHGVLHLLGHDHADPAQKSVMWAAQSAILEAIGLGNIVVRES